MMKQNASSVGVHNRTTIISILLRKNMSRADLAKITGLTRASVSIIVDDLLSEGIVREKGAVGTKNGRRPILLEIAPKKIWMIGFDISRNDCVAGACDLTGKVLDEQRIDFSGHRSVEEILCYFSDIVHMFAEKYIDRNLLGAGITAPGPLNANNGCFLHPVEMKIWDNYPVCDRLKEYVSCDVWLENTAVARAVCENYYGLGREFSNFIELTVYQGIGCGMILDNKVYVPENGISIGVGHTTINYRGARCRCGNIGCLEMYAMPERFLKPYKKEGLQSWRDVVRRAETGDPLCRKMIKKEAGYLVSGLIGIINLFSPQAIILSGELSDHPQILTEEMERELHCRLMTRDDYIPRVCVSAISEQVRLKAACAVAVGRHNWERA